MLRRLYQRSVRAVGLLLALIIVLAGVLLPTTAMAAPANSTPAVPAYSIHYTVRPGDTLSEIAKYYGTSVSAIMHANGLTSTRIYVGQVLYIPSGGGGYYPGKGGTSSCSQYYYVRRGDTLSGIAARFGVSTYALARANGISNPSFIYAGQRLCIPGGGGYPPDHGGCGWQQPYDKCGPSYPDHGYYPPYPDHGYACGQYYVVQPGDNLSRIAARCGKSVHSLIYLNGLRNPSIIHAGQVLRLY